MNARSLLENAALVVFDLDDTLFCQGDYLSANFLHLEHRSGLAGLARELGLAARAGSDSGRLIDTALAALGVSEPGMVGELVALFKQFAPAPLPAHPAAAAVLGVPRRQWLLTDGSPQTQNAKIAALGIGSLFERIIISDAAGREYRKPCPTLLVNALAEADVPASEVVIVGDRPAKEVELARAIGCRVIRVRSGEWAHLPSGRYERLVEVADLAELVGGPAS